MDMSRRVYPLDPRELTEEQIAVAFAMTSRNPQPFDEIAKAVTEERGGGLPREMGPELRPRVRR